MWFIEKINEMLYDEKSHKLLTATGACIASIEINEFGLLEISPGVDTLFVSDSKEIHGAGWNGCEEHMGCIIRMDDEGGILEYCKNRCSILEKEEKGIKIKIVKTEGSLIPEGAFIPVKYYIKSMIKSSFEIIKDLIKAVFMFERAKTQT
jgi:hypothetical protein